MDSIVALDVVTAKGEVVHVTTGSDYFWALRGAADSFGIITHFYSQSEPAPSTVINWGFTLPDMYTDRAKFVSAVKNIQSFAQNASFIDRKISFGLYLDGTVFNIAGMYFGDASYFNNTILPELFKAVPYAKPNPGVQDVDWIKSMTLLDGSDSIAQPVDRASYKQHSNFFAKSLTIPEESPLTDAAIGSFFDYIKEKGVNPPNPWFSIINLYGGPDSQIVCVSSSSVLFL